jgi:hypothetical protein
MERPFPFDCDNRVGSAVDEHNVMALGSHGQVAIIKVVWGGAPGQESERKRQNASPCMPLSGLLEARLRTRVQKAERVSQVSSTWAPATQYDATVWILVIMPEERSFDLFAVGDNAWVLRPNDASRGQFQASRNDSAASRFDVLWIAADSNCAEVVVCTPEVGETKTAEQQPNTDLIEAWLYYLRRTGRISFDPGPRSDGPQRISGHLSLTHRDAWGGPLTGSLEGAILEARGIATVDDLLKLAPSTSLVGLALRAGLEDGLERVLSGRVQDDWLDLITPIYLPLTTLDDGAQRFTVAMRYPDEGELWLSRADILEHCHVHVSRFGRVTAHVLPIDALGLEPASPGWALHTGLDQVCALVPGDAIHVLVEHVPHLVTRILTALLTNGPSGIACIDHQAEPDEPAELAHWQSAIMSALENDLFEIEQCARWRVYPFDGESRPLPVAQWLEAEGDEALRSVRMQALRAMPFGVAGLVLEGQATALGAIDQSQPLLEAVQQAFQVPAWVVRRAMNSRSAVEGRALTYRGTGVVTPLSKAIRRIHALGREAPEVPLGYVPAVQWLMDVIGSDRDNFKVSKRTQRRVMRAVGRTAARSGWTKASRSISSILRHRRSLALFDCVASATVALYLDSRQRLDSGEQLADSVCDAWLEDLDASTWLKRAQRLTALQWNPDDPDMAHALDMAAKEWVGGRTHSRDGSASGQRSITNLFHPFTWLDTRISVYPLCSRRALEQEGLRMENCMASKWPQVRNHEDLIVALEDVETGIRANASLQLGLDGQWKVTELRAARNAPLEVDSPLEAACTQVVEWISSNPLALENDALDSYKRRSEALNRLVYSSLYETLSLQAFPSPLRDEILACLPGDGALDVRLRNTLRRVRPSAME